MNNTDQTKLYNYYAKKSYWTREEAVALSLNFDPRIIIRTNGRLKNDQEDRYYGKDFCKKYDELMELVDRAIEDVELPSKQRQGAIYSIDDFVMGFSPIDFIQWAKHKEIELPKELEELVTKYDIPKNIDWEAKYKALEIRCSKLEEENNKFKEQQKSMDPRLKATHDKIFIGLIAVSYTPDAVKNNTITAKEISDDLYKYSGIQVSEDTINRRIKESKQYLIKALSTEDIN